MAGIVVLLASPALAVSFIPGTTARTALEANPAAATVAIQSGHFAPLHIPELAAPEPTPTPAPTATPTPPPVVHITRVASATSLPATAPHVAAAVPRAVPHPPAPPAAAPGTVQQIIIDAANRHNVSAAWMLKIAQCESGYRPNAYNGAGPYVGLFQFLPSTFAANGGTNIYDPYQQADITATMLAAGRSGAWGCA